MSKSKIEWTDRVWNPVTGCTKVSQGCKNCYAETIANRFWGERKFTDIICHEDRLNYPLHLKKPQKIFVNSMSDLFHEKVPFEFILKVFSIMHKAKQHTFQILTKRPERILELKGKMPEPYFNLELFTQNIWLGISCEDQKTADERIPILLQIPAAVRWLSVEPMLGKIDLSKHLFYDGSNGEYYCEWCGGFIGNDHDCYNSGAGIDWVVVGGESGPHARPMHPDWVRSIRDQCQAAGVPFYFKQWGECCPAELTPRDEWKLQNNTYINFLDLPKKRYILEREQFFHSPKIISLPVGKRKAGSMLDGVEYKEFPKGVK